MQETPSSLNARCPRCDGPFLCGALNGANGEPCACQALSLPPGLAATLRQRYSTCLCIACLTQLAADDKKAGAPCDAPARC